MCVCVVNVWAFGAVLMAFSTGVCVLAVNKYIFIYLNIFEEVCLREGEVELNTKYVRNGNK